MSHLLSSAMKMQTSAISEIEYQFEKYADGQMAIYYNGEYSFLNSGSALLTDILIPTVQDIQVEVTDDSGPPFAGCQILYYINDAYITTYTGTSVATTPFITTSAGNTYRFQAINGGVT